MSTTDDDLGTAGPEAPAGLIAALRERYGEPAPWELLLTPDQRYFIDTAVRRVELGATYANPTHGEASKPAAAFTPDDASAPVLADWSLIQLFRQHGKLDEYPCFLMAGERRSYRLDPTRVKVGIVVAGGTAAGLNMVVDSLVKRHFALAGLMARAAGTRLSLEVVGFEGGYDGIGAGKGVRLAPSAAGAKAAYGTDIARLTDPMAATGGSTIVRAGRSDKKNGSSADALRRHAQAIWDAKIDILYTVGGDGTLAWAGRLADELQAELQLSSRQQGRPVPVIVGGPKTMDNDIAYADSTFGFRTAVAEATRHVVTLHDDVASQGRIGLVELFGAGAGWVALHACYNSGVGDVVLIPELVPKDPAAYDAWLDERLSYLERRFEKHQHAVAVVAEGALPEYKFADSHAKDHAFANLLQRFREYFGEGRQRRGKPSVGISDLRSRYLVRATAPDTTDLELCRMTGKLMVETALAGFTGCSVQRWQNQYVLVPLHTATGRKKPVPTWDFFFQSFQDRERVRG